MNTTSVEIIIKMNYSNKLNSYELFFCYWGGLSAHPRMYLHENFIWGREG